MNLAWMAALALVILLEKSWRHGRALSLVVGVLLIAYGFTILAFPELAPGLVDPGTGPGMEPAMQMDG